jgi:hypothetical protein
MSRLSSRIPRFVDRDMFMRFRGGGVGHRATGEHTEHMSQEADMTIPDENEDEDHFEEAESLNDGERLEDDEWSSDSDIGEGDDDEVEDKFEGEDGQEPWGIDEYTTEGYAPP